MTIDGSKLSERMHFDYDAVFTKKSFDQVDNNDIKTILVEKIEFLTRLCFRMHEKIEVMVKARELGGERFPRCNFGV